MRILAIDASTKSTGLAIFEDKNLTYYDCITSSSTDLIKRIKIMTHAIDEVLTKYPVDAIVLEEVRPEIGSNNIKTMKALMYLQAAIMFLMHERYSKVEIELIYPSSWRAALGIKNGRGITRVSAKQADIDYVEKQFGLIVNDDIADAICIGYAHVTKAQPQILNWE